MVIRMLEDIGAILITIGVVGFFGIIIYGAFTVGMWAGFGVLCVALVLAGLALMECD
jgi:hypothetical protein